MDGLEPGQELRRDLPGLLEAERASLLQHVGERDPVHELHRDQLAAVELDEVEHAAHVRRDHLARRADFLAQAVQRPLVGDQPGSHRLEGDVHAQLEIEGAKDLPHAAAPEQRADAVAVAENLARGESWDGGADGRWACSGIGRGRSLAEPEAQQARQAEAG